MAETLSHAGPAGPSTATNKENRQLVTDEPVELEKYPVEFEKIMDSYREISKLCLISIKENQKITTCNRLDLET